MKRCFFAFFITLFALNVDAQREFEYDAGDTTYIMKRYVFMLLESGEKSSKDSTEAAYYQKVHLEHLNDMAKSGKLIVAGPFEGGHNHRGLLIFDVETVEEALKLEGEDPMVKTNRLRMDAFFWWGAKGTVIK